MSNTFEVDGQAFDLSLIPQSGLLVQRAVAHIIRNEASSRVRSKLIAEARDAKRKTSGDAKAELSDDERRAIKYDGDNAAHKALYTDAQAELADTIRSGKIGESNGVGAPRKSEFEKRVDAMCRKAVISSVQSKLKLWVGEKKMPKADMVFKYKVKGEPVERTFGELVESYYKVNKVTVERTVQRQIDEENKAAERAAKSEGEGLDF